jgi:8-oxo-dGTP diphosphatase
MTTAIAIAVVRQADRVLIGRRGPDVTLSGLWEFPGGKIMDGESPAEAAARECREETGLDVEIGPLLAETAYDYPHGSVRLQFFAAKPRDPLQPPAEPFRWVSYAELSHYEFPPANAAVLAIMRPS